MPSSLPKLPAPIVQPVSVTSTARWGDAIAHITIDPDDRRAETITRSGEAMRVTAVRITWTQLGDAWSFLTATCDGLYLHPVDGTVAVTNLALTREFSATEPLPTWLDTLIEWARPQVPPTPAEPVTRADADDRATLLAIATELADLPPLALLALFTASRRQVDVLDELRRDGVDVAAQLNTLAGARSVLRRLLVQRRRMDGSNG